MDPGDAVDGSRTILNSRGGYRFLPGIEPYSSGVVATSGFEIVHVTLATAVPWQAGLCSARGYLESLGLNQHALCGVELRCPRPHTMDGFIDFNRDYRALLNEWDIPVDGQNPVARTNVAPVAGAPAETALFGFSYCCPSDSAAGTFVVAGGGELPTRALDAARIVRAGDVSPEAMAEKARCVVQIMNTRLTGLGARHEQLTMIDVYTAHDLRSSLADILIPEIPAAAAAGIRWFYSRPPIVDIEFEMDMRGVRRELVLDLEC